MTNKRFLLTVVLPCVAISVAATATDAWFGKPVTCAWLGVVCLVLFWKIRRLDKTHA